MKSRWVPAALVTVAFVAVALVASHGTIDVAVLIWAAVGVFGAVFGIATAKAAGHADKSSTSVEPPASRAAEAQAPEAQAPVVRAASVGQAASVQAPATHSAAAPATHSASAPATHSAAAEAPVPRIPEASMLRPPTLDRASILAKQGPKHSAEQLA
ncbi:hypothetical protein GCM10027449_24010 [Sinomonas notoginsengisoli]|uniref:hypothetical protein n=1 Tax=Sinomonas notoginsengisoli TaxID=1457311 RepID=UPI001F4545B6|nr:hypothetical protein [Sinomonas notoginsengisoli]